MRLPGAMREIDFDDIVYSERLRRVIVPARRSGLYVIEPDTGTASRLGRLRSADSADEGAGRLFVLERDERVIDVLDERSGRVLSTVDMSAPGDYIRYVRPTGELWVTEPAASPSGIEIFTVPGDRAAAPRHGGFIPIPNGPEGFTSTTRAAYTHAGKDLVAIDISSRTPIGRWSTGCSGTHGFPRVDQRRGLVLASCSADGEVALLDADNGRQLGRYSVGGGEALPAYSSRAGHFYVRGDPGPKLAALTASREGLKLVRQVEVPKTGHCLTADTVGHYWSCDANGGRVLRFDDPQS